MKIFIILLLVVLNSISFGQNNINKGRKVCVDGLFTESEWNDSKIFTLCKNEVLYSKVYLKHDGENLLMVFTFDKTIDSAFTIPEFFIDTKLDKSDKWEEDDYWFHVSAQDCYSKGKREDYSNCRADYLVWRASPNWPFGKQPYEKINAIEISVPFKLIGVKPSQKIGLCFSVVVFPQDKRFNFPTNANEDKPSTWMEFTIIY